MAHHLRRCAARYVEGRRTPSRPRRRRAGARDLRAISTEPTKSEAERDDLAEPWSAGVAPLCGSAWAKQQPRRVRRPQGGASVTAPPTRDGARRLSHRRSRAACRPPARGRGRGCARSERGRDVGPLRDGRRAAQQIELARQVREYRTATLLRRRSARLPRPRAARAVVDAARRWRFEPTAPAG
jgi:hypothetical protein